MTHVCFSKNPVKLLRRGEASKPRAWLLTGWLGLATLLAAGMAGGCATKHQADKQAAFVNDVAECRQVVAESLLAVKATMLSINEVSRLTNACSSTLLKQLTHDVHRLNVDSLRVRSRAQAMHTRGPAYFEQWHTNLHQAKEPELSQRAERSRLLLQGNFDKIREATQPTREAFKPFMRSVRKLRNELEKNAERAPNQATVEFVKSAVENGEKVEQGLSQVLEQLTLAEALLKPVQTAAK